MFRSLFRASAALMVLAAPAAAMDAKIFPYPAAANYCPYGLQPVQINGVICCGSPNQGATYQQWNRHPVRKRHVAKRYYYDGSKSPATYGSKSP
ncbi:hypothetical protein [Pseudooceanicola aestuarii]|uniref:hypothetical protein n=1 Tax=Pseudooceanicola aestuarii TaxID=2697319 RepID=UPI001EF780E7|nr:hypothetical protein [Pseudooceanicola aestuarii]